MKAIWQPSWPHVRATPMQIIEPIYALLLVAIPSGKKPQDSF